MFLSSSRYLFRYLNFQEPSYLFGGTTTIVFGIVFELWRSANRSVVFLGGFFSWFIAAKAITRLQARFTDGDFSPLYRIETT